jgi:hypothetical protein
MVNKKYYYYYFIKYRPFEKSKKRRFITRYTPNNRFIDSTMRVLRWEKLLLFLKRNIPVGDNRTLLAKHTIVEKMI